VKILTKSTRWRRTSCLIWPSTLLARVPKSGLLCSGYTQKWSYWKTSCSNFKIQSKRTPMPCRFLRLTFRQCRVPSEFSTPFSNKPKKSSKNKKRKALLLMKSSSQKWSRAPLNKKFRARSTVTWEKGASPRSTGRACASLWLSSTLFLTCLRVCTALILWI